MVPFARRVRTIRMCSLDARGEGPIQATLLKNGGRKRYTRRKMTACWPPVLAQRVASEGPRWTRAVGDQTDHPLERSGGEVGKMGRESSQASFLPAERAR